MDANKNNFQTSMQEIEGMLSNYKNKYPRNISDVVDNNIPKMLIILAIIMFAGFLTLNLMVGLMTMLFAPLLLAFGLKLKKKMREKIESNTKGSDISIKEMNVAIENLQNVYGEYPDVKEYIDKLNVQIQQVDSQKKKMLKKFNTGFYITIIAIVVAFISLMVINLTNRTTYIGTEKYSEILNIKDGEPLMTLTPFNTQIAEGYNIETQQLDFQLKDNYFIRTANVKISGANADDTFIIWIVANDGNVFDRSPKFVFNYGDKEIESHPICYNSNFTLLNTLMNLKENAKNLKFKIEKVEK